MSGRLTAVIALVLLAASAHRASGEFWVEQTGEMVDGGSWAVPLSLLNLPGVDFIAVRVTEGDVFSDPAFTDFTLGGWSQTGISGDHLLAAAEGPPIGSPFSFSLHFAGVAPTADNAVMIDIAAFSGGTLVGSAHGAWTASHLFFTTGAFTFADGDWDGDTSNLGVPAPGAGLLGIVGLAALSFVRRRV